jgi:hypothetical protein
MNIGDLPPVQSFPSMQPIQPVEPRKWYEIWWAVWRHPGVDTFRSILLEPTAGSGRAALWVGATAFIAGLLSTIFSAIFTPESRTIGSVLICTAIAAPISAVIGTALSAGIYHLVALAFGGKGKWEQLFFCFAAIQAPETVFGLLSYLFYPTLFAATTLESNLAVLLPLLCLGILGFAVAIYSLVLFINAIDAVENVGTGKAIAIVLIPTILAIVVFVCLFGSLVAIVSQTIN